MMPYNRGRLTDVGAFLEYESRGGLLVDYLLTQ